VSSRVRRAALLAAGLALAAGPARAEPHNPYEGHTEVLGVDGAPKGISAAERIAEIRERLQAALVYPLHARRNGLEGTSRIQFTIGPDGHAQDVRTAASSGHASLDRAAERCAVDAGQLPRVLGRLEVPIRFSLEDERRREKR
jgi:TonB family protein